MRLYIGWRPAKAMPTQAFGVAGLSRFNHYALDALNQGVCRVSRYFQLFTVFSRGQLGQ
jgi:hypothetical protein